MALERSGLTVREPTPGLAGIAHSYLGPALAELAAGPGRQ